MDELIEFWKKKIKEDHKGWEKEGKKKWKNIK
jgi:hypothetical protein